MNDNISRKAAIDAMWEIRRQQQMLDDTHKADLVMQGIYLAEKALERLPSAQPKPKTGKWIRHDEVRNVYGGTYVECSECGEKYVVQYIEDEKYCRNRGADMKGEQNE